VDDNVRRIGDWVEAWVRDRKEGVHGEDGGEDEAGGEA
jgi:hypothetical protein